MKETDRESEPCGHDDGKLSRIIVTFDSPHMTASASTSSARWNIETIKSTPEVKR